MTKRDLDKRLSALEPRRFAIIDDLSSLYEDIYALCQGHEEAVHNIPASLSETANSELARNRLNRLEDLCLWLESAIDTLREDCLDLSE